MVSTLDHFKEYVWGPHFRVMTDHAALLWLTNLKNIQGMLARCLAKLQQFNFAIEHRPGTHHANADGLSHCPQCDKQIVAAYLDEEDVFWRTRSAAGALTQLVVPMSLRDTIFNDSHHTTYGGHFGMTHTHSKIQLHYFWPGMSDFIRDKITACHMCVARKSPVNRHQLMGHVPVSGKFERVAMDLLDVSVISGKGHKYILVVCDYFTKYTEA